nr:hypothetical protein Itr_chr14CG29550 [Ipomoea trifida]GMD89231.1 hypothetical protein Iba_chr14cCG14810 [Ipomoea batatas]GMD93931.1 hypothetical protein Iba_chr14fCG12250 [Ipomoea batatas]GMD93933.1 hypothetical protein Iba_chr14fCG12270 [Ipomoea batatas]GME18752.1 hypothetical protein Iba_scaffold21164CG0010 [Ipomoea batatas]
MYIGVASSLNMNSVITLSNDRFPDLGILGTPKRGHLENVLSLHGGRANLNMFSLVELCHLLNEAKRPFSTSRCTHFGELGVENMLPEIERKNEPAEPSRDGLHICQKLQQTVDKCNLLSEQKGNLSNHSAQQRQEIGRFWRQVHQGSSYGQLVHEPPSSAKGNAHQANPVAVLLQVQQIVYENRHPFFPNQDMRRLSSPSSRCAAKPELDVLLAETHNDSKQPCNL